MIDHEDFEIEPDFDETDEARQPGDEAEGSEEPFDDPDFRQWWAETVPDFLWLNYPFDIPPGRMPFATRVMTMAGAPRHCPELACRRARKCQGGDGPPCFRADREELREVLFLAWAKLFLDFTDEEIEDCLSSRGSRYTLPRSGEPPDGVGWRP
jgi:hypothetical protein